jgi:hypothetical protein
MERAYHRYEEKRQILKAGNISYGWFGDLLSDKYWYLDEEKQQGPTCWYRVTKGLLNNKLTRKHEIDVAKRNTRIVRFVTFYKLFFFVSTCILFKSVVFVTKSVCVSWLWWILIYWFVYIAYGIYINVYPMNVFE